MTKTTKLSKATILKNRKELEELVEVTLDRKTTLPFYNDKDWDKLVEDLVDTFSKLDRSVFWSEVVELNPRAFDWVTRTVATSVYKKWVDVDQVAARQDNLLSSPDSRVGWEDEFARATASVIAEQGTLVDSATFRSVVRFDAPEVAAVFNVTAASWTEEGYGEDDRTVEGFEAEGVMRDGTPVMVRYEGTLTELMMTIMSRAFKK